MANGLRKRTRIICYLLSAICYSERASGEFRRLVPTDPFSKICVICVICGYLTLTKRGNRMQPRTTTTLVDTQSLPDHREVRIDRVGVTDVRFPIDSYFPMIRKALGVDQSRRRSRLHS